MDTTTAAGGGLAKAASRPLPLQYVAGHPGLALGLITVLLALSAYFFAQARGWTGGGAKKPTVGGKKKKNRGGDDNDDDDDVDGETAGLVRRINQAGRDGKKSA
jgi:hypothetical protein